MLVSYRRLSPRFQFSLSGVTLVYLSQWELLKPKDRLKIQAGLQLVAEPEKNVFKFLISHAFAFHFTNKTMMRLKAYSKFLFGLVDRRPNVATRGGGVDLDDLESQLM